MLPLRLMFCLKSMRVEGIPVGIPPSDLELALYQEFSQPRSRVLPSKCTSTPLATTPDIHTKWKGISWAAFAANRRDGLNQIPLPDTKIK